MEISSFIEKIAMQFDNVNSAEFNAHTKFRDIEGWSSLIGFSIIAMVDEEYEIKIKANDINKSQTIEDLFKIVKSRI